MKIYFASLAAIACAASTGCKSTDGKPEKQLTAIRIYLEADKSSGAHAKKISILRDHPTTILIQDTSFLDERFVESAMLVDWKDSFFIRVKFDWHGTIALDNATASNPGKHLAIEVGYDKQQRWLAAPAIQRRISDGTITFTPDASREEAERIVRGLSNLGRKIKSHKKFDQPPAEFDKPKK